MRPGAARTRATRIALGIGTLVLVITVALDGQGVGAALEPLLAPGGWIVLLAVPVALGGLLLQAEQHRAVLGFAGARIPGRADLLSQAAATSFGNMLLPAAGTFARLEVAHRRDGASRQQLVAGSVAQYAALAVIAAVTAAMLAGGMPVALAWAGATSTLPLIVAASRIAGPRLRPARGWMMRVATVEAIRLATTSLRLLVLFKVFGGSVHPEAATIAASGSMLAQILPIVPSGLGVREALITAGGQLGGIAPTAAAASAVVDRILTAGVAAIVLSTSRRPGRAGPIQGPR